MGGSRVILVPMLGRGMLVEVEMEIRRGMEVRLNRMEDLRKKV